MAGGNADGQSVRLYRMLSRPIAIEAKPVLPPLWGKAGLTAAPAAARTTPAASAHRGIIGVLEARERFGPRVPDRMCPDGLNQCQQIVDLIVGNGGHGRTS